MLVSLPSSVLILVLLGASELCLGPFLPSRRSLTCGGRWGFIKVKSIIWIYSNIYTLYLMMTKTKAQTFWHLARSNGVCPAAGLLRGLNVPLSDDIDMQ